LIDLCDAVLLDLDGTVLLAGAVIPHAADAIAAVRTRGCHVLVVTNNASRAPATVAGHLKELGIPMDEDEVINSPMAAADLLVGSHRPGDPVLVIGTSALADTIADAGLGPVYSADDDPVAVVQGYDPELTYHTLAEGCLAIRAGADWVATNVDTTLPTDRGLLPGNGALVDALATATGRRPRVAGKPERILLDTAARRARAQSPLVVGDRLTTDIAAAVAANMPSLMVLTGVHTTDDILATAADSRPTYVAADLRGLTDPTAYVRLADHDDDASLAAALSECTARLP
jgi:HAD superfamily hydrolase (TIGR01450 family)